MERLSSLVIVSKSLLLQIGKSTSTQRKRQKSVRKRRPCDRPLFTEGEGASDSLGVCLSIAHQVPTPDARSKSLFPEKLEYGYGVGPRPEVLRTDLESSPSLRWPSGQRPPSRIQACQESVCAQRHSRSQSVQLRKREISVDSWQKRLFPELRRQSH